MDVLLSVGTAFVIGALGYVYLEWPNFRRGKV